MSQAAFHYRVEGKFIKGEKENGEIDFWEFNEKFENNNPIIARELAFEFYENRIRFLLEDIKGIKYESDRQAREALKSFIEDSSDNIKQIEENNSYENSCFNYENEIWVYLVIDFPIPYVPKILQDNENDEFCIHGIYNREDVTMIMYHLGQEYEYYKHYNYQTNEHKIEVLFYDSSECDEGYLGNDEWAEGYYEPNICHILKTPFDWDGYDRIYWWGKPKKEDTQQISLEEIIESGETNQIEFKSSLVYNFKTNEGGLSVKEHIAKAICAFLNSNGGLLLIGVTDDGVIQGLSYDFSLANGKKERDYFRLQFDQMLSFFFKSFVRVYVKTKFYQLHDKDIFAVAVSPCYTNPCFIKGKNGNAFYIRGEASSRQLTDIEEIVAYYIDRFNTNNSN